MIATIFATCVSFLGLSSLLFGSDIHALREPSLLLGGIHVARLNNVYLISPVIENNQSMTEKNHANKQSIFIYQQQALFVFDMAFLGAYLWGLQYFSRRYFMNDLILGAFYQFAIRMIFSAVIALLIYHSVDLLATVETTSDPDKKTSESSIFVLLPAIAFFIGTFPQKGVKWLGSKLSFFMGGAVHPSIK